MGRAEWLDEEPIGYDIVVYRARGASRFSGSHWRVTEAYDKPPGQRPIAMQVSGYAFTAGGARRQARRAAVREFGGELPILVERYRQTGNTREVESP